MPRANPPLTSFVEAEVSWRELVEAIQTVAADERYSDGAFSGYDAERLEQAVRLVRERVVRAEAKQLPRANVDTAMVVKPTRAIRMLKSALANATPTTVVHRDWLREVLADLGVNEP